MNSSIRRIPRRSGSKIDASLRASAHTGVAIPWIFLECSGALVGATIGRPLSFRTRSFLSPAEKEKNGFNLPEKERGLLKPELQTVPPSRQKKPAPFRFRRGGENSISAAFFFLPKL